ncbi:MAG: S8 family serine peptidase [Candidatus Thorarchaeota archaeon]
MKSKKIYPLFLKLVENKGNNSSDEFRTIISFDDITKRDSFISENKNLEILNKFDLIPSIVVKLGKESILKYDKVETIKNIEEDQRLYLSILDVHQILNLNEYKRSQISCTGKYIKIGIIDDGINRSFPSISKVSSLNTNQDMVPQFKDKQITHGTIMASIIGNQLINQHGNFIGIAPDIEIIDLNISNSSQEYYFSSVLEVLDIINNQKIDIDILLISLTTREPSDGLDILSSACNMFVGKGFIIVCPVGNYGPKSHSIGSPSAALKTISFSSLTKSLTLAKYSGKGPTLDERIKPDFCLLGDKIKIPLSNQIVIKATGTSVAAAIGAGFISLIKQFKPKALSDEIYDLLKDSCTDMKLDKHSQGHGMPNIVKILKNLNFIQERILPYPYLTEKALKVSIGFIIILIIIFYFLYFFRVN